MAFSITGLSGSGLDTTQIVGDLMAVERIPYTNLQNKKSNLQSEQAVFRQLNTKLSALQNLARDLQYSSAYNKNTSKFSASGVATATVGETAVKGSYNIEVLELAQHKVTGLSGIKGNDKNLFLDTNTDTALGLDTPVFSINTEDPDNTMTINLGDLGDPSSFKSNADVLKALVTKINNNPTEYGGKATLVDVTGNGDYRLNITAVKGGNQPIGFELGGESNTFVQAATDAKLKIDGIEVTRSTNEINDLIDGITLNLSSKGTTTLSVERDTSAITNSVESFVKAYNDLIDLMNINLAKPDGEDSINPLQGDTTLKSLKDELYSVFTGIVFEGNQYVGFMEELGLSVDKYVGPGTPLTGKIAFDKTAFANALSEDPSKVTAVFTDRIGQMWERLSGTYTSSTQGIIAMKISGYDSEIKVVDERLEAMERSLQMKEARLKQQFNNMELMLNSLNSTSDWLKSQFDSLSNMNKK
ncbi:flagellar filament capping protein FliD [Paenibacillus camelliae]|uniref:flagellar filament capping protein FliD n=1 Tax=Paenibacillus camelliae TaxID=512410 RepID=UPI00203B3EA3|nr:flagellar filament capping protein FliD [Paenibacillus camelliae]MCM3635953.1 flagellar filament capping protein FliD [Paenibacillus camelliae]